MISAKEYNTQWNKKLVKNKEETASYIKFFSELEHNLSGNTGGGLDFSALDSVGKDKKPETPVKKELLKSDQLWVEGKRSSFALYLWDPKTETNYYLKAGYFSNSKYYSYSFSTSSKTMYALRYFNNYPIIVCLDDKIPKKYFIIEGNSFKHTNDVNKAIYQSVQNFYFFKDEITNEIIKKIEAAEAHAAKIKKYIIIASVSIGVIILLIIIYKFAFSGKKKKTVVYDDYDEDEEEY